MTNDYDPLDYPPALNDRASFDVVSAQSLTAMDLGKIVTLDVRLDYSPVHARITGELREVHHDFRETSINIGAHDRDDAGSKVEWTIDHSQPVAVWQEKRG